MSFQILCQEILIVVYLSCMEKVKMTLSLLEEVVYEMREKITSSHISQITVVNSTDLFMQFSFYNKEKLFISLNHQNPFISFINRDFNLPTIKGGFSENLRKNIKNALISDISTLGNDRIIIFTLTKTDDFFIKHNFYLVIELIPTKSNLLILDKDKRIIYAYHHTDLSSKRPIVKGLVYEAPESKNLTKKEGNSLEELKNYASSYLLEAEDKKKRESQKPLYDFLVGRLKSLKKKLQVLNQEIEIAEQGLIYKEYGENIFAYSYDQDLLKEYINELGEKYNPLLNPTENANKFFNKYKKNKRTIELDNEEIKKTNQQIIEIENIINVFTYLDEEEINELYNKYLSFKMDKLKKVKADARLPYYIEVGNTMIGFGKNAKQNEYLTFKKASKNALFFHINEFSGSHIVIFSDTPSKEEMLIASELCLILSNKEVGDVKYTEITNIKKASHAGEVIMDKYQLITLRSVRDQTYKLLKNQKRFSK